MAKKTPRDPELEARWAEARRLAAEAGRGASSAISRACEAREERRRARLRRLTFGLLGR